MFWMQPKLLFKIDLIILYMIVPPQMKYHGDVKCDVCKKIIIQSHTMENCDIDDSYEEWDKEWDHNYLLDEEWDHNYLLDGENKYYSYRDEENCQHCIQIGYNYFNNQKSLETLGKYFHSFGFEEDDSPMEYYFGWKYSELNLNICINCERFLTDSFEKFASNHLQTMRELVLNEFQRNIKLPKELSDIVYEYAYELKVKRRGKQLKIKTVY